ncbi:urease accessory protein UreD [Endozoicomonas gorgoniicola]|uniref:Urease accessory protein UreD n=1 Tax=Endozoicomonas gorgoniicola TaxID=1234144 RepID=A0ABT3MU53_9GAMM|nr:urease accessory protein UreD [Endozoicomonas gorgoniicola]MCW7552922.1 urease accessory protein UreD [Endozoicomonas gorgoniicola]
MNIAATPLTASREDHPGLDTQRWLARFSAEFSVKQRGTRLGKTEHFGPLRVQRPFFPEGPECLHFYLLHPPGGLVGGDQLSIDLVLRDGAHVLMTTPSAGKIYNNISGIPQGQHVSLTIDDGTILEYLPQENIVFDGADGQLITTIDISGDGLFLGWEITCLGRFESEQFFERGQLMQSLMLRRDGRPLFSDRLQFSASSPLQESRVGFNNYHVFGTFLINRNVMSDTNELGEKIIAWQEGINSRYQQLTVAVTQKPDAFIARILGNKAEQVRNCFEHLWQQLRTDVVGREACAPRIWRT